MKNRDYWRKREEEALARRIKNEAKYNKVLSGHLQDLYDSIDREINAFYGKYATDEGITLSDAKLRADTLDMEAYSRKAARYVREKNFSPQANEEMKLYNMTMKVNRLELLKANIALETVSTFDDVNDYVGEVLTTETMANFTRLSGILGMSLGSVERANAIVNASFKGATFSENIWGDCAKLNAELSKILTQGLISGKGSRQLARGLRKVINASRYETERLVRTELTRVVIESQAQSLVEAGFEKYEYMTCSSAGYTKNPVCDECRALDGKIFALKDKLPGTNAPPMHPNCRCCITPYIEGM